MENKLFKEIKTDTLKGIDNCVKELSQIGVDIKKLPNYRIISRFKEDLAIVKPTANATDYQRGLYKGAKMQASRMIQEFIKLKIKDMDIYTDDMPEVTQIFERYLYFKDIEENIDDEWDINWAVDFEDYIVIFQKDNNSKLSNCIKIEDNKIETDYTLSDNEKEKFCF